MSNALASREQREASDPDINAWVAANAGSGKTRVLVDRIIRLMLDGAEPQRILCLTFTKAAAAEMANRLFERLGAWITLDDETLTEVIKALELEAIDDSLLVRARKLFTLSLETPGGLKIQTIHAFAERLLQLFPVEAGVAPGFEVMDERATNELLVLARGAVLVDAQNAANAPHAAVLAKIIAYVREDNFESLIAPILAKRSDLNHILADQGGVEAAIAILRGTLGRSADLTLAAIDATLTIDHARYRALANALNNGSDADRGRAQFILNILAQSESSLDMLSGLLLTKKHQPKQLRYIATSDVVQSMSWIADFIAEEQCRLLDALDARSDLVMLEATEALLKLAAAIVERYEREKRRTGRYDFDDLISRTRRLLTQSGAAQWVLYKLDGGIDHILIDEAQDTSPAQWEIVEALAEEFFSGAGSRADVSRTFFAVGDRKQSIFSFQGADPDAFIQAAVRFEGKITSGGRIFKHIPLYISYRSTKWVLQAVDRVFELREARAGVEARIETNIEHRAHRSEDHGLVEIWPLIGPDEVDEPKPWRAPVDAEPQNHPRRKLAAKIARRVASWVGKRSLVSQRRAVRAGDILILVQRRNAFFDAVIRELRRHGVPVAGADRLKLGAHLAVRDVFALAQFTLLPEDDYTLACVLKSPLVSRENGAPIDDSDLFELAYERGTTSLWEQLRSSQDDKFGPARVYLERWRETAAGLAPFDFFSQLLVESRADILRRLGPEANDPLDALLDIALDFERSHPATLPAFLSWFAGADTEIKRDMDQGADEVRVMTVHGAKGLESHIVILPDTIDLHENRRNSPIIMVRPDPDSPEIPFWVLPKMVKSATVQAWYDARKDSAGEEHRRLLYVAMTRARDELYVCGWYNQRQQKPGCWYDFIRTAITPHAVEHPDMDGDMVWRMGGADTLAGMPISKTADASPLPPWFRQPVPPAAPVAAYPQTLSAPAREPVNVSREQRIARGRFVHRLLEILPTLPHEQRVTAALQLAKSERHGEEIAMRVVDLIHDSHFAMFFTAGALAEAPIAIRTGDGEDAIGRIDRLMVKDSEVLILDYKSDANPPIKPEQVNQTYLEQLAAYRTAVQSIFPDRQVRTALLWTEGPRLMELPASLLDRAAMHKMRFPDLGLEP